MRRLGVVAAALCCVFALAGFADDVPGSDVAVVGGPPVSAAQGDAVTVPFEVTSAGGGSPTWTVAATTTAPGSTATPSAATVTPGGYTQQLPVSLKLANTTPAGTYDVTLTLTSGTLTRTGTRQVAVTEKRLPPPIVTTTPGEDLPPVVAVAMASGQKLASSFRKGLKLRASCNEACAWTLKLFKGRTVVATGKGKRAAAGRFIARAKWRSAAKKRYKRTKKLRLTVLLEATDGGGLKTTERLAVTLRR